MKTSIYASLAILGVLVGTQLFTHEKVDQGKGDTIVSAQESGERPESQEILLAGNVPCNPAKQVCED